MELTPSQLQSHIRAAKKLDKIKDEVFEFIKNGVTEYEVQQFILKKFEEENLTSDRMRPIVAVEKNSKDPHYTPTAKKKNDAIMEGALIMIDLWAKEKNPHGTYADITWMAYISPPLQGPAELEGGVRGGKYNPPHAKKIFKIVIGARDETIRFIKKRLKENKPIRGYEADEIARNYIIKRGYGKNFIHSTGHSLDKNVHGSGVKLSPKKTSPDPSLRQAQGRLLARRGNILNRRKIPQNMPFTIEPGVYLENFGVRSEINCYINDKNKLVITTEVQKKIVAI